CVEGGAGLGALGEAPSKFDRIDDFAAHTLDKGVPQCETYRSPFFAVAIRVHIVSQKKPIDEVVRTDLPLRRDEVRYVQNTVILDAAAKAPAGPGDFHQGVEPLWTFVVLHLLSGPSPSRI
ncbi:hypothetical protein, partial [Erythrobacter donghaensis]|uniref:hypothetical protein n=1 Tax=Erythrobacter donghaensis TaxID=267135 RepID=UPI001E2CB2D7